MLLGFIRDLVRLPVWLFRILLAIIRMEGRVGILCACGEWGPWFVRRYAISWLPGQAKVFTTAEEVFGDGPTNYFMYGTLEMVPVFEKALLDWDHGVRLQAIRAFGKITGKLPKDLLFAQFSPEVPLEVQSAAAQTLSGSHDPGTVDFLIGLLMKGSTDLGLKVIIVEGFRASLNSHLQDGMALSGNVDLEKIDQAIVGLIQQAPAFAQNRECRELRRIIQTLRKRALARHVPPSGAGAGSSLPGPRPPDPSSEKVLDLLKMPGNRKERRETFGGFASNSQVKARDLLLEALGQEKDETERMFLMDLIPPNFSPRDGGMLLNELFSKESSPRVRRFLLVLLTWRLVPVTRGVIEKARAEDDDETVRQRAQVIIRQNFFQGGEFTREGGREALMTEDGLSPKDAGRWVPPDIPMGDGPT